MSHAPTYRLAVRESAPLLIALAPFGMVYGAIAAETGLTLTETLGLSVFVYAGASQLLGLQLIVLGTPIWAIVISMVALNFRHILYSATLGRRLTRFSPVQKALAFFLLVDPAFAACEARFPREPVSKTYYFVFAGILYASWILTSLVGAVFGNLIENPRAVGMDMILPIYFLAQTMAFRRRRGFLLILTASFAASIAAYLTLGSPWHVTIGGGVGILIAVIRGPRKPAAEGAA